MRAFASMAVLALSGCTLLDSRGEASLEIAGSTLVSAFLDVVVHADHGDQAAIAIDGQELPDVVAVNAPVRIDLLRFPSRLSDGRHAIRARVLLSYAVETQALEFVLDRTPPAYRWDPVSGVVDGLAPFQATLTAFDALSSVPDDGARLIVTPAAFAVVRPLGGGRFRIESEQSLSSVGEVSVSGTVQDAVGNVSQVRGDWWWAWWDVKYVTGSFEALAYAPGTVRIAGSLTGCPGGCQLVAGGVPLTTLGLGPFAYDWDTRGVPEGTYHLRVTAAGAYPLEGPDASVDRTSPVFLGCELPTTDPGDYGVRDRIAARYDEALYPLAGGAYLTIDGVRQGNAIVASPSDPTTVALCMTGEVPVPSSLALVVPFGAMGDLVGNQAPASQCAVDLPVWRRPAGAGPASAGGQPLQAVEVAALVGNGGFETACHTPRTVSWIWVSSSGTLQSDLGSMQQDPARRVTGLASISSGAAAWSEVDPISSQGKVYFTRSAGSGPVSAPVNLDPAADARQPSLSHDQFDNLIVAWSEATTTGGRTIRVGWSGSTSLTMMSPASDDPVVSAESPTVAYDGLFVHAAFVERTANFPARVVHKRYWGPNWDIVSSGNVDSTLNASEPSLACDSTGSLLAWVEEGAVYGRVNLGEPVLLNSDPLRRARLPHAFFRSLWSPPWKAPALAFVEDGPQGDRIVARQWDGTSWNTLLDPNVDVPGLVLSLQVQGDWPLSVAWVDDQGRVYLRVYNE